MSPPSPSRPDAHGLAQAYQSHFAVTWERNLGWENARFVVLDTESTGVDVRHDRLITIGAVGVMHYTIHLEDSFEVLMPIAYNNASVHIHGITREAAEQGLPEPDALAGFLDYLRDGIIVGHHINHDIALLNAACERQFGFQLRNLSVDTLDLALRLEALGAFPETEAITDFSLDGLCRRFAIEPHDRHTAPGDAFLTAQIFLILLKLANRHRLLRLGQLTERLPAPPH